MVPAINLTVEIKLDDNGRPSVDPNDVVKFTQQMLFKAALERTNSGTMTPGDMTELSMLLRDMNTTALTTRKLDQEEKELNNQRALVETFKQLESMLDGKNIYGTGVVSRDTDPYANVELPSVEILSTELTQGEQALNPDLYLRD